MVDDFTNILELLLAFDDDDALLLLLLKELFPELPETTYDPRVPRFHLDNFTDIQCKFFSDFIKTLFTDFGLH